jgi:hypothetical protein
MQSELWHVDFLLGYRMTSQESRWNFNWQFVLGQLKNSEHFDLGQGLQTVARLALDSRGTWK